MQSRPENDPFADALESYYRTGHGKYRYTREDGRSREEDAWWYFTGYRDFPLIEKRALRFVRGRVLDIGCGAGRHSLYLQRKGFEVTAMDASPRVAALAHERGVRDARVASACKRLPLDAGEFDTVLLFGNNLGICGSYRKTAAMLRELARITSARARVLTTTLAPGTFNRAHLRYWNDRLAHGEEFGVARYRLDFRGKHPRWVSLLLLAPTELMRLAWANGWTVTHVLGDGRAENGYAAVLEKRTER